MKNSSLRKPAPKIANIDFWNDPSAFHFRNASMEACTSSDFIAAKKLLHSRQKAKRPLQNHGGW
jgi:hypothetical protein